MSDISLQNRALLGFIDKFPKASTEAIAFFYKSEDDNYVSALNSGQSESIAIVTPSESELDLHLRKLLLLTDLVAFNAGSYSTDPPAMLLPIPHYSTSP